MQRLQDLMLSASNTVDPARLPPRFAEAQDLVRRAIAQVEDSGIAEATLASVLVSEAMPRLVGLYGPPHAARILAMFARCIAADAPPADSFQ